QGTKPSPYHVREAPVRKPHVGDVGDVQPAGASSVKRRRTRSPRPLLLLAGRVVTWGPAAANALDA
ncbi:hypothetical protein, partial [Bifidobacterium subtile]|uniref:hypothetical protein n=1 Tax=Bifidobacterium subtile TaxID=77635 RepID=UPI0019D3247A